MLNSINPVSTIGIHCSQTNKRVKFYSVMRSRDVIMEASKWKERKTQWAAVAMTSWIEDWEGLWQSTPYLFWWNWIAVFFLIQTATASKDDRFTLSIRDFFTFCVKSETWGTTQRKCWSSAGQRQRAMPYRESYQVEAFKIGYVDVPRIVFDDFCQLWPQLLLLTLTKNTYQETNSPSSSNHWVFICKHTSSEI